MLPKTVKLFDEIFTVVLKDIKSPWEFDSKNKPQVVINRKLSAQEQGIALLTAASCYIVMNSPVEKMTDYMYTDLTNNVFRIEWYGSAPSVAKPKKKKRSATSTVMTDMGDDIRMIKRVGH